jgi:hypothetical protein
LPWPCCILMQRRSPFPQRGLDSTFVWKKNQMLKLLLLLAAVAALAVAAPLAAPDFNDLDDSDLDASDNDASDLDASDNDASDLEVSDENNCESCSASELQCKANQYLTNTGISAIKEKFSCTNCPLNYVAAYGPDVACGSDSCFPCPFEIDSATGVCVTKFQKTCFSKSRKSTFSSKSRLHEMIELGNVSDTGKLCSGDQSELAPPEKGKEFSDPQNSLKCGGPKNLQMAGCATGLTCCLPGYYGASSSSCTLCPSNKPSSSFSAPNSACQCPNSASTNCFACTNKCRPYDSASRMCLPYQCPSGKTCRTVNNAASCQ